MICATRLVLATLGILFVFVSAAFTSAAVGSPEGKVVIVKMIDNGTSFRFSPLEVTLQRGNTLRFVQEGTAPHNVEFKELPKGTKIKKDEYFARFLFNKGDVLDIVIDERFALGEYKYVCTPHESLGMKAKFTVVEK